MPAIGDEDIRRLDIAVNNAFCVSGIQCVSNLNRQTEQNFCLHRLSADALFQRFAIQKLHGDECFARYARQFHKSCRCSDDSARRRLGFALETAQGLRVFGHSSGRNLRATNR